jgi:RNA polymerase sigma factor (sigma-70 family)
VWLRAFAARGGYDPAHADALPWLYGNARNVLREHWRASLQAAETPAPDVVDPWDEVNARLDSDATARTPAAAVRALPASVREVLLLVAWEQLTPAEAADVLGIPQGTARSRLHRARTALRLALGEEGTCRPNTHNLSTRTANRAQPRRPAEARGAGERTRAVVVRSRGTDAGHATRHRRGRGIRRAATGHGRARTRILAPRAGALISSLL